MHPYDLSPLFRSTVGFDRLSQLIDSAFKADEKALSYPPYNIERLNDDEYRIVMAVAGFGNDDLQVNVQENTLTISGEIAGKDDRVSENGVIYLHKGIATRSFERKFSLADHVRVTKAELKDGLLTIDLLREVPEAAKPRSIPITSGGKTSKVIEGNKHA